MTVWQGARQPVFPAAFMAERLALPMQYVRKKPKGFGRNAQIEGYLPENSRVLLVEDLATDGGSKFMFADALRKAGAECNHVFVVFYYDIFAHAREELEQAGLQLHYLASWWDVLEQLKQSDKFDDKTCEIVEAFLRDQKAGLRPMWATPNKKAVIMAIDKIIIDTDPGIDDAMAIHLAFADPRLELLGLTTIFGNVFTHQATRNALHLVEQAGSTIPGCTRGFAPRVQDTNKPSHYVHGDEGVRHIACPKPRAPA